ncbi:hypothetical protein LNKW23_41730 [Paralimibaculum aggregatum]|uniref:Mobilization protein n=1 Tax=Paralimibaculum aggregatum TaxID=3036245 RepID=A0ABQ6LPH9_9RHOB|nr:hypothetical protein LNKW23_41730 [Limibaculum sp. NKW23]
MSLRLTEAERARLERDAAGRSLSAHIRERLFGQAAAPRQGRNRAPVKDHHALARVLSQLGRTGLAKDFETLADAADDGILRLTPETEAAIRQACTDIAAIRRDLIAALGLKPE